MAAPGTLDIEYTQGDDYSLEIDFEDNTGAAIDYTGNTFTAQVRPNPLSSTSWSFTVDATSIASGILTIALLAAQTAAMPEFCVWDLQMDSSVRTTLLSGNVHVKREVTR